VVITLNAHDSLTLKNVSVADLSEKNFQFV